MGDLRLSGLTTGIDTGALVKQLMVINSQRLARYKISNRGYDTQLTALKGVETKVSALSTAVGALSNVSNLETYNSNSSDGDVLTVATTSEAGEGSHTVQVKQLATSETWIHDTSTFEFDTDYVGAGKFIFSYNYEERIIETVAGETSLKDLVNLINDDEGNPGVTASLLNQNGIYHLMLTGQDSGTDYQISINSTNTEELEADFAFQVLGENALLSSKLTELDEFGDEALGGSETITIEGTDHDGTVITPLVFNITSGSTLSHLITKINDTFDGIAVATLDKGKIVLTDLESGTSTISIDLTYDNGGSSATLTLPTVEIQDASKEGGTTSSDLTTITAGGFIETQTAQDSKLKVDGYPASGTQEVQALIPDIVASAGTFTLTYRGQTTDPIAYGATIGTIQTEIDSLTESAGDITVSGDPLDNAGLAGLTFTFKEELDDAELIRFDFSGMAGTGPTQAGSTLKETTKGDDGWIDRNSNSVNDVLTGITFLLHDDSYNTDTTDYDAINISLYRNTNTIKTRIQSMVTAYNDLLTDLKSKTEYDDQAKRMGILSRDIVVALMKEQIHSPFVGVATGFLESIDPFTMASDIGITFDSKGMMEFDTSVIDDAMKDNFNAVLNLLGASQSGSSDNDNFISFYSAANLTTAGEYDVRMSGDADGSNIEAYIKLSTESTYRRAIVDMTSKTIRGSLDYDGNAELGLELRYTWDGVARTFDPDTEAGNPLSATVRVRQGFTGELEDMVEDMIKADGRLEIGEQMITDKITAMDRTIENEEARLEKVELRLVLKFARLERTLTLLQNQMGAVSTFNIGASL